MTRSICESQTIPNGSDYRVARREMSRSGTSMKPCCPFHGIGWRKDLEQQRRSPDERIAALTKEREAVERVLRAPAGRNGGWPRGRRVVRRRAAVPATAAPEPEATEG